MCQMLLSCALSHAATLRYTDGSSLSYRLEATYSVVALKSNAQSSWRAAGLTGSSAARGALVVITPPISFGLGRPFWSRTATAHIPSPRTSQNSRERTKETLHGTAASTLRERASRDLAFWPSFSLRSRSKCARWASELSSFFEEPCQQIRPN